jgi:hypothetical protein
MNNYITQSNKLKITNKITNTTVVPMNRNQVHMAFNSKNSFENTDTEQLDALKFLKQESIESSQKSVNLLTCRI